MSDFKDKDGLRAENGLSASGVAPAAGFVNKSVNAAVSAAGSTIADATALTAAINAVTTVGSGQGVKLPDAPIGAEVIVQNLGANNLEVYPHGASGVLNSASAGVAITLAAATDDILIARRISTNNWIASLTAGPAT